MFLLRGLKIKVIMTVSKFALKAKLINLIPSLNKLNPIVKVLNFFFAMNSFELNVISIAEPKKRFKNFSLQN